MDAQALENEAQSAIASASTREELDDARVRFLGRKSELKQALRAVRDRETGMTLNAVRERLEAAVAQREAELERAELERTLREDAVDVTLPGDAPRRGRLHLITQIRREVEDVFLGLGYEVVDGREVESTHYNFEGLNFDFGHPARSPHHSLFLNGDVLLRTE
ncbi:MAG: phenylalanine--tRNA ligase subunit alpha, partial [Actinomycetota bacterium]|nr:phenylalanine--tRNA ligase subunit alpha [Actinomycetota bacterium]